MAQIAEKKSEQVLVMLSPSTHAQLVAICRAEDRPMGYVARELMLRGLTEFNKDGILRDPYSPHKATDIVTEALKRVIPDPEPEPDLLIRRVIVEKPTNAKKTRKTG